MKLKRLPEKKLFNILLEHCIKNAITLQATDLISAKPNIDIDTLYDKHIYNYGLKEINGIKLVSCLKYKDLLDSGCETFSDFVKYCAKHFPDESVLKIIKIFNTPLKTPYRLTTLDCKVLLESYPKDRSMYTVIPDSEITIDFMATALAYGNYGMLNRLKSLLDFYDIPKEVFLNITVNRYKGFKQYLSPAFSSIEIGEAIFFNDSSIGRQMCHSIIDVIEPYLIKEIIIEHVNDQTFNLLPLELMFSTDEIAEIFLKTHSVKQWRDATPGVIFGTCITTRTNKLIQHLLQPESCHLLKYFILRQPEVAKVFGILYSFKYFTEQDREKAFNSVKILLESEYEVSLQSMVEYYGLDLTLFTERDMICILDHDLSNNLDFLLIPGKFYKNEEIKLLIRRILSVRVDKDSLQYYKVRGSIIMYKLNLLYGVGAIYSSHGILRRGYSQYLFSDEYLENNKSNVDLLIEKIIKISLEESNTPSYHNVNSNTIYFIIMCLLCKSPESIQDIYSYRAPVDETINKLTFDAKEFENILNQVHSAEQTRYNIHRELVINKVKSHLKMDIGDWNIYGDTLSVELRNPSRDVADTIKTIDLSKHLLTWLNLIPTSEKVTDEVKEITSADLARLLVMNIDIYDVIKTYNLDYDISKIAYSFASIFCYDLFYHEVRSQYRRPLANKYKYQLEEVNGIIGINPRRCSKPTYMK